MSDGKPRNEGGRTTGADSNVGRLRVAIQYGH
jgi:hypothetical protein